MGRNSFRLGRVFGIEIKIDYSWFIVFVLVTWSLASQFYPNALPGVSVGLQWLLGAITSVLFFASVVAHELSHSFVSQAHGVPVRDITLFIFGGAAQISEEPKKARDEFLMALAGPLSSFVIAAVFGIVWLVTRDGSPELNVLAGWLAGINVSLGVFNLIPGFPLDGGRVFRSIVWSITGNLKKATRIATGVGRVVAYGLIFLGVRQVFTGNIANGLWIGFIGWFLDNAATASYRRVALQEMLAGHIVREVMRPDCTPVPGRLTVDVMVDQVILPSGRRCFPVVDGEEVRGMITLHRIKGIARDQWPTTRVEDVMIPRDELKTVKPDDELSVVFERMASEDINQFPVMDDGHLLGTIGRDNVLALIRTLSELER